MTETKNTPTLATLATLAQRHQAQIAQQRTPFTLRMHRALSWLQRAERAEDEDGRFIFLWIAFNAAYATEIDDDRRLSEQETFKGFLEKLCDLDEHQHIEQLVWQEFSSSIRIGIGLPAFTLAAQSSTRLIPITAHRGRIRSWNSAR